MRLGAALFVVLALASAIGGCATGTGPSTRGGDSGPRDGSTTGEIDAAGLDAAGLDAAGADTGTVAPVDAGRDSGPVDAFVPAFDAGMTCTGSEVRPCSTTCSTLGAATCSGGVLGACVPPAEVCDGVDQDCDTRTDETLSRGCTTACGSGTETCTGGSYRGCTARMPVAETCDGTDQDCDARTDESLTRGCTSACGSGTETCSGGTFGGCTAPMPGIETCNRADEDCDTRIDEGFQVRIFDPVPMSELTAAQPGCSGAGAGLDQCMTAAKRWCIGHAWGCFNGGAGHLQATATGARVACFGNRAVERMATFAEVSTASGISITSANVGGRVAQSAANRYCRSNGYEAGAGPVEYSDPNMWVICLPSDLAAYTDLSTSELVGRGCDPVANPSTLTCQSAADLECRERGHQGGYGPVEWNSSMSAIVCYR